MWGGGLGRASLGGSAAGLMAGRRVWGPGGVFSELNSSFCARVRVAAAEKGGGRVAMRVREGLQGGLQGSVGRNVLMDKRFSA